MSCSHPSRVLALLAVGLVAAKAFSGHAVSSSVVVARTAFRPALRSSSRQVMSLHSPAELASSLVAIAADVSDDFDVNSLPAPIQNLLLSPIVLAIPITLGMTVAGLIILFLLWSMGAF